MLGTDANTGKALEGMAHLRQSIRDILGTPLGSRVMRRDYGSELPALGRSITLSGVYAATHVDGVQRVALESPQQDMSIDHTQAAYCIGIELAYGGVGE